MVNKLNGSSKGHQAMPEHDIQTSFQDANQPASLDSTKFDPATGQPVSNKIWTIPNVLSFLRLIGVPIFLILILQKQDLAAVILLAVASLTDLLDGRIARRFNQISRLGQMLDPLADRLYILATLIGLVARGIVPLWLFIVLVGRDLTMLCLVPALKTRGFTSLPVNFIGKAATFMLLIALPLMLLGAGDFSFAYPIRVTGWAFSLWGAFLYWWAAGMYIMQTYRLLQTTPPLERKARR